MSTDISSLQTLVTNIEKTYAADPGVTASMAQTLSTLGTDAINSISIGSGSTLTMLVNFATKLENSSVSADTTNKLASELGSLLKGVTAKDPTIDTSNVITDANAATTAIGNTVSSAFAAAANQDPTATSSPTYDVSAENQQQDQTDVGTIMGTWGDGKHINNDALIQQCDATISRMSKAEGPDTVFAADIKSLRDTVACKADPSEAIKQLKTDIADPKMVGQTTVNGIAALDRAEAMTAKAIYGDGKNADNGVKDALTRLSSTKDTTLAGLAKSALTLVNEKGDTGSVFAEIENYVQGNGVDGTSTSNSSAA